MILHSRQVALAGRLAPTDLDMDAAELVCLIGPNGSGKTSLLHSLAGIGAWSGQVRVDGLAPSDQPPDARKRLLAYLPASREAAWPLTARDLVRLGLPTGAGDEEAERAIKALEIAGFAERRVDQLSTGERSRVLIARALAPRPRLLLLDEPAANLDPLWQLRLMMLLRDAVSAGQGAIVAMHDLDLAGRFADRLVLMDSGRIIADGEPATVLESAELEQAFGIRRIAGRWDPATPPADPRSSP